MLLETIIELILATPQVLQLILYHNKSLTVDLTKLRGICASVVLTGTVTEEFGAAWTELRAHNIVNGFDTVEYAFFPAQLVEQGRDSVCHHALKEKYDWLLMVDADAVFKPDLLQRLLHTAFITVPDSHVVGAYAQLKHSPYLPVIDTGTGTWEPHFPGEGVLPCIRTGGHCILVKTSALRAFGPPWFRTRENFRPIDALRELDNYSRIKMDGTNPFADTDAWRTLLEEAHKEHGGVTSAVGEDSAFCDALLAAGGRLYVDTGVVTGHVSKKIIRAQDLRDALKEREELRKLSVGVY